MNSIDKQMTTQLDLKLKIDMFGAFWPRGCFNVDLVPWMNHSTANLKRLVSSWKIYLHKSHNLHETMLRCPSFFHAQKKVMAGTATEAEPPATFAKKRPK